MGITQKYSLKWNDFTVNVASTFRDLHARQDFVDVTLACADGSTLEAHKVVLSSVSSYFRDILKVSAKLGNGDSTPMHKRYNPRPVTWSFINVLRMRNMYLEVYV